MDLDKFKAIICLSKILSEIISSVIFSLQQSSVYSFSAFWQKKLQSLFRKTLSGRAFLFSECQNGRATCNSIYAVQSSSSVWSEGKSRFKYKFFFSWNCKEMSQNYMVFTLQAIDPCSNTEHFLTSKLSWWFVQTKKLLFGLCPEKWTLTRSITINCSSRNYTEAISAVKSLRKRFHR